MKFRFFLFAIPFFISGCKSISEKPPSISDYPILKKCDSIGKIAKTDYNNGIREYDILGTVEVTEFDQFYWKYMQEKYNIKIKANDQPSFSEECYANSMNFEIEEEYGQYFIDRTIEDAKIEYEKRK